MKEIIRKYGELNSRIRTLYSQIDNYIGPWTSDQKAQFEYYSSMKPKLKEERDQVIKSTVPNINKGLKKEHRLSVEK